MIEILKVFDTNVNFNKPWIPKYLAKGCSRMGILMGKYLSTPSKFILELVNLICPFLKLTPGWEDWIIRQSTESITKHKYQAY
jgi:hypothetical protein